MQFRDLPSVDRVMASDGMAALTEAYPRDWVVDLVRRELDRARQKIRDGGKAPSAGDVVDGVGGELRSINEVAPRQVINATGVIVHTNLGRAPLSQSAIDAMTQAARGYTDLEMDLSTGRRGSRQAHLQSLLQQVTGAEAALAVNNNASALLLGLSALSVGKEVIVSRGEAVEIGGGFRIPDVLKQSGATLVDVGTTNRTYIRDYQDAITENTAAMLKVHSSNFRVEGFTAEVEPSELVELSKERGIPVLHDVGSGALLPTEAYGLAHEPTPQQSIAAGVGLVFFSGDKLLGGPQSGIVVGQTELVRRLERHPLARAVRIDKMNLAGLTATVLHYLKQEAEAEVPIWRMISASEEGIKDRAARWKTQLSLPGEVISGRSAVGGGSLPGETLPTWVLALSCEGDVGGPERVMRRLREANPPVVARIEDDRVILDPRTVMPEEEESLLTALRDALSR
ncbi:MAG: L-seryl-tRNA(Sec) selenium transferase [Chloroflexota bacterium]|nr:L-seryl-tRNA(Sec) selenium transferase [Chloroflexota bacterium]